jgi:hypothetical protein
MQRSANNINCRSNIAPILMALCRSHRFTYSSRTRLQFGLYGLETEKGYYQDEDHLKRQNNIQRQNTRPIPDEEHCFRPTVVFAGHYLSQNNQVPLFHKENKELPEIRYIILSNRFVTVASYSFFKCDATVTSEKSNLHNEAPN